MRQEKADQLTGGMVPWGPDPERYHQAVQGRIRHDAMTIGVVQVQHPRVDELLANRGVPEPDLIAWCNGGFDQDRLFRAALRGGWAITDPNQPDLTSPLAHAGHVMMHMMPDSIPQRSWWWFMLVRKGEPFSPMEQQLAGLMLRQWAVTFDRPEETDMHRLLIGHDDRLIMADVGIQQRFLGHPGLVRELLDTLHPAVAQRYPDLPDLATRDVAVKLADQTNWVCFHSSRAINHPEARHLYMELRPLGEDELPPVGQVKDERIAQAIAFVHENFARSPSLAEIARAVHVSPFHFHRLFTRQVGLSPKHYLQRKQLQVAKWMLRRGGVPIGDIARKTGFSSHGHFTSTFHRLVGMSPSEYREQH